MTTTHARPTRLLLFLVVAMLAGFGALVLSVQNALALSHQGDQRNIERIASDYGACLRGNDLRQQVLDQGHANDELVTGILDTVLPPGDGTSERSQAVAAIRQRLAPLEEQYRSKVDAVKLVNCDAVIPGGRAALERTSR